PGDRPGGAPGRILPSRPGGVVGLHPTAVLRAPRRGVDPSGWEEALVRDVEEPPRLQSRDSTGRTDAANAGGEAAFRAEVYARAREAGADPPAPPAPPHPPAPRPTPDAGSAPAARPRPHPSAAPPPPRPPAAAA